MKEYFVACCFLDQGMEGIPNLTPAFIIEAKKRTGCYQEISERN